MEMGVINRSTTWRPADFSLVTTIASVPVADGVGIERGSFIKRI